MTAILLIIIGALFTSAALVLLFSILHAPLGHEDAAGFHSDERKVAVQSHTKLGGIGQEQRAFALVKNSP